MADAAPPSAKGGLTRFKELAWQALPAIASAIGFAGFVAVVGGAIEWVRFWAAGLPADQAVKVIPNQELVTIGAVALISFTVGGLAAVLALYLVDRNGNLTFRMLCGLLALGALEMAVTLVFAHFDWWAYVLIGLWILVTGGIALRLLGDLVPGPSKPPDVREADDAVVAALRTHKAARERLEDLEYARTEGGGGLAIESEIRHAQLERALALSRWRRAFKQWTARHAKVKLPDWSDEPPAEDELQMWIDRLDPRAPKSVRWFGYVTLAVLVVGGPLLIATQDESVWIGVVLLVVALLTAIDLAVARATAKFAWYGLAVFFSVLMFGAVLNIARVIREPEVQPVALVRTSDDKALCGIYITENDKRVYVGRVQQASKGRGAQLGTGRIFWVPSSDIAVVSVGPLQSIKDAEERAKSLTAEIYADRAQETPKDKPRPVTRPHPDEPATCATVDLTRGSEEGPGASPGP